MGDKQNFYVNTSQVSFGLHDFIIDTGIKKNRSPGSEVAAEDFDLEIIMSPQHFKSFAVAISKAIKMYEEIYGDINLDGDKEALRKIADGERVL